MTAGKRGGGVGCLQILGIGCLGFVILTAVAGVLVYYKWKDMAAMAVEAAADGMMTSFEIPAEEREAAMVPIRGFTRDFRDGKVSIQQGAAVAEAIATGPAGAAIAARGFETKYVKASGFSDAEKAEAHVTLTRFAHGVAAGTIPQSEAKRVWDMVSVTRRGATGTETKIKDTLTREELMEALAVMKGAADAAGVETREFKVDLAAELRRAIETGMAKGAEGGRPPGEGGASGEF